MCLINDCFRLLKSACQEISKSTNHKMRVEELSMPALRCEGQHLKAADTYRQVASLMKPLQCIQERN